MLNLKSISHFLRGQIAIAPSHSQDLHHGQLTEIFALNEWRYGMAKLTVTARMLPYGQLFTVKGRDAWALIELVKAGAIGCTPIDSPGPRWSGYVFNLKRTHGLDIETIREPHRGAFPGTHARYMLLSAMEIVNCSDVAKLEAA